MMSDDPTFDQLAVAWLLACEYCKGYPDAKECECDGKWKELRYDSQLGN